MNCTKTIFAYLMTLTIRFLQYPQALITLSINILNLFPSNTHITFLQLQLSLALRWSLLESFLSIVALQLSITLMMVLLEGTASP